MADATPDLGRLAAYYHERLTPALRAYLLQAGITAETVELFQIGADEPGGRIGFAHERQEPCGGFAGRLIFPVRDLDDQVIDLVGYSPQQRPRYKTHSGSLAVLFNRGILEPCDPVFLCERVLDAVALTQGGFPASAVLGGANFRPEMAADFAGKDVFLVFGSNYAGRRNAIAVAGVLSRVARAVYVVSLPEAARSAAELFALEDDGALVFANLVEQARREQRFEALAPDTRHVDAFAREVLERSEGQLQGVSTGFLSLDRLLLGGLREGVYLLAGAPGMGKTTFLRQLADQVLAYGAPVVFLSMETSAFELWAKSIARELQLPVVDVLMGRVEAGAFRRVSAEYGKLLERMWTIEGSEVTSVAALAEKVAEVANHAGAPPVVIIDGLQRLPVSAAGDTGRPWQARGPDVCLALKHLARRTGSPVIGTVPVSRDVRDLGPAGACSAPELAEIEHIADVVAWLRASGSRTSAEAVAAEMAQDPSRMVLEVLKSRNGTTGALPFMFYRRDGRFAEGRHATGV
jgi:replicative DNA helicase